MLVPTWRRGASPFPRQPFSFQSCHFPFRTGWGAPSSLPYSGPLPWLCLRLQLQSPGRALPSLGLVPPPFAPARLSDRARGAELSGHSSHPYFGGEGWRERCTGPTAWNQTSECQPSFPGAYFRGVIVVFNWGDRHLLNSSLPRRFPSHFLLL